MIDWSTSGDRSSLRRQMTVSGLTMRTAESRSRNLPAKAREQPSVEGPPSRTLDLPARNDDLLAQEDVLRDEHGTGNHEGEHEVP